MKQTIIYPNIVSMAKLKTGINMLLFKTIILFIMGGWEVFTLSAQDNAALKTSEFFQSPIIGRLYKAPRRGEGSPYLMERWWPGKIVLLSGDTIKNVLLKMDCYKNELIWMSDGKSIVAIDPNLITGFSLLPDNRLSERKFMKLNFKLPLISDTVVKYLEVLNEGPFNLYSFRKVDSYPQSVTGNAGGLFMMNAYDLVSSYYIQAKGQPVKVIEFNKKSLIKAYPEFADKMKKLLKEKHYGSIKNEYQLIQAVQLVNANW